MFEEEGYGTSETKQVSSGKVDQLIYKQLDSLQTGSIQKFSIDNIYESQIQANGQDFASLNPSQIQE